MSFVKRWAIVAILSLNILLVCLPAAGASNNATTTSVTVPSSPVAESNDFATRVLRDSWDMSEYTDVSQYLNESGQRNLVANPQTQNGIFSGVSRNNATSLEGNAYFFPLFPGYIGESDQDELITVGKIGALYPINAATYHCLYMAMKVGSGPATSLGPDGLRVLWFADRYLNMGGRKFGLTYETLYPEAVAAQPTQSWRLYKIDLANPSNVVPDFLPWNSRATWQGIRIDPTTNSSNTPFQVDWVRLTDCGASNRTISFTPSAGVNAIWLRPVGTTRDIRVATGVNGSSGSYSLDTQGIAPGAYLVGTGTTTTCCTQISTSPLVINQTPVATFAKPSFTSGTDYSTSAGNPWDFANASDVKEIRTEHPQGAFTSFFQDDSLNLAVASGPHPAGVDIQVKLNAPAPAPTAQYRYLTFRMYTEWKAPWQNIPDAMIARWIWSFQGTSGRAGFRCTLVGADIPYDIGWQTYTVDLYDSIGGVAEDRQGECPAGDLNWRSAAQILDMRFDPNENITVIADPITGGGPLTHKIDWMRLTQVDSVKRGQAFPILISLNKSPSEVADLTYYYTSTPQQPTQNVAQVVSGPPPPNRPFKVYVPLLNLGVLGDLPTVPNSATFLWDTTNVAPGTYYLCVRAADGVNTANSCSEAQVVVTP